MSIYNININVICGVAERWVNIGLFFFKKNYKTTQVIMVTWVTKKKGIVLIFSTSTSRLKLMVTRKVTASKFIIWRLWRWENLITFKDNIFLRGKCAGKSK